MILSKKSYGVIRLVLGGLFVYSGSVKLMDLTSFAMVIDAFSIVPWELRHLSALCISTTEVLAGAGLISDIRGSLATILTMLLIFMMVLLHGIYMGYDIDCGCFGENDPVGRAFHGLYASLVRDIIMLFAVFYLYLWRKLTDFRPLPLLYFFRKTRSRFMVFR